MNATSKPTMEPFRVSREDRNHSLLGNLNGSSPVREENNLETPLASLLSNEPNFSTTMRGFVESTNSYPFRLPPSEDDPYGHCLSAKEAIPIIIQEAAERRALGSSSEHIPSEIVQFMAHTLGHVEVNSAVSPVLDVCILFSALEDYEQSGISIEQQQVIADIRSHVERSFVGRVNLAFEQNVVRNNLPDESRHDCGTIVAEAVETTNHTISSFLNLSNGIGSTMSLWLMKELCGGDYLEAAYAKLSERFKPTLRLHNETSPDDLPTIMQIVKNEDSIDRYHATINMDADDHSLLVRYCQSRNLTTALTSFDQEILRLLEVR
jgi:hypothetical protein